MVMTKTKRRKRTTDATDQGPSISDYYRFVFSIPGSRVEVSYESYKRWKEEVTA